MIKPLNRMRTRLAATLAAGALTAVAAVALTPAVAEAAPAFTSTPCSNSNSPVHYLLPGQSMASVSYVCAGDYMFASQNDGNFVIYNNGGTPVWASGTNTGSPNTIVMATNGNLLIYNSADYLQWQTGTGWTDHRNYGAYVCFQTDGNMVLYAPNGGNHTCSGTALWASGT
ncbi:hypothetical protein GXW83_17510 [Streptacidiphilus sp. PB12-B1b]|uniref:hypothetical protein n=1 Tax=Streptacidiphilus sp. PB12-B1b TaxID=2705012 RepID=UPI0015FB2CBD|nr:hypothetical protein [Streptacidiphilus sp. PB12-B1b]QMU77235.1 hypothetical protein GXW83_17510 [Streptacidiphilus sp. PB12-B1b]